MEFIVYVATVLGAYLLGSIPTGYLVARARGVDIRQAGVINSSQRRGLTPIQYLDLRGPRRDLG